LNRGTFKTVKPDLHERYDFDVLLILDRNFSFFAKNGSILDGRENKALGSFFFVLYVIE
jgi:hypothetical protein